MKSLTAQGKTGSARRSVLLTAAILAATACGDESTVAPRPPNILERLKALPGVIVTEIPPSQGYGRVFRLDIMQPVDHAFPNGRRFPQRAYLFHVDETVPMVFAPGGYDVSSGSIEEMAAILGANCLKVSHRYYGVSRPDPPEWHYLTIEQAAADHHRIVEIFNEIYTGIWLSAGASKSGMTSLYHRRFYPDDVKATIAYVSPFMFSTADSRFADFLATLGTQECRDNIHRFQRTLLEHSDSLLPRFSAWYSTTGNQHPADTVWAFERAVAEYDWVFWQYYDDDCARIPGPDASYDEMSAHLHDIVNFLRVSDGLAEALRPFDYQSLTQLGSPKRRYDHIADLLTRPPGGDPAAYFEALGIHLTYSAETILDIYDWLRTQGDRIVYIYGGNDPLTGGAIELSGQPDALKVVQPDGNHSVRIADLHDQQSVIAALEGWLGIPIPEVSTLLSTLAADEYDLSLPWRAR
jgi:hypothetical protein